TEEGSPKNEWLCNRRWNALVYVQPDKRFVIHPTFDMHGTTVVITWKGSTCSVCHHCKESGHWTEKCTPTHRTLAAQKKLKKLEPSPLPHKAPTAETPKKTAHLMQEGSSHTTKKQENPPKQKDQQPETETTINKK